MFSSYLTLNNVTLKRSLKVIETGTIRKLECGFLFAFHSNYGSTCISSEIKRDIGQKSWFFHILLHSAPLLGWSPSEYFHPVWCRKKTRMVRLPEVKKFEDMYNRLDTIPAYDGQTDERTDILPRHSPRYAYASRGKNRKSYRTLYMIVCAQDHRKDLYLGGGS